MISWYRFLKAKFLVQITAYKAVNSIMVVRPPIVKYICWAHFSVCYWTSFSGFIPKTAMSINMATLPASKRVKNPRWGWTPMTTLDYWRVAWQSHCLCSLISCGLLFFSAVNYFDLPTWHLILKILKHIKLSMSKYNIIFIQSHPFYFHSILSIKLSIQCSPISDSLFRNEP